MQPIATEFTKLLNIKSPIVAAPMYFASTPELAMEVTASGGLGMIGAGFSSCERLTGELNLMRSKLNIPEGEPIPIGIGFLGWILDGTEVSNEPRIPVVLKEKPLAVWLAFGNDLGKYVAQIREYDSHREHKTMVFVMTHTVEEALRAANEWKVDVVVVQGTEAGGHGGAKSPPLLSFLQAVVNALPNGPPIVAAGGISTGPQIAALLTMGAHGVALGTRFLYTDECMYPDLLKSALIDCELSATARGHMFDEVLVIPIEAKWPANIDGRAISNKIVDDLREGLSLEERIRRVEDGMAKGEKDRLIIWAGEGVGLIKEIKSTKDTFHDLHGGAVAALKSAASFV